MPQGHAIPRPALIIVLLALLPFPVLLVLIWSSNAIFSPDRLMPALLSYTSAVTALMGGAHWALAVGPYGKAPIAAEWLIGLAALIAAWLALVIPMQFGFSLLIAAFFLRALRDALMAEAQGALPWFARLKSYITAAGIVTSILALIRIII
jgi:hypothetical protein